MFPEILGRYREQIRYADRILGGVVDRMKAEGVYEDSVLVVVSDHGVRIWGDIFSHVDLIARVPVFLRIPGMQPEVRDEEFQLSDIAPTLLEAVGCPTEKSGFDGYSALKSPHPTRAPTVHFKPADFVCVFDSTRNEWLRVSQQKDGAATITEILAAPGRGFFAIQVIDDAMASRESGSDFLTSYMDRHFPESVTTEDAQRLQGMISAMTDAPQTAPNYFKRGIYYFFLALTETHLLSTGHKLDAGTVNAHWTEAADQLRKAGDLQPWVAEEIERLLLESDLNGDRKLNEQELAAIIRSRKQVSPAD